ncbi:MAG: hypothetical protein ABSE73_01440 [Planctomycetota bacterium]
MPCDAVVFHGGAALGSVRYDSLFDGIGVELIVCDHCLTKHRRLLRHTYDERRTARFQSGRQLRDRETLNQLKGARITFRLKEFVHALSRYALGGGDLADITKLGVVEDVEAEARGEEQGRAQGNLHGAGPHARPRPGE